MSKKKKVIIAVAISVILALVIWGIHDNLALETNGYTIVSQKLPDSFVGYRIAQVSDLHNAQIGKDNEKLIKMLKQNNPDVIAITGDIIDSRHTNIEVALDFAEKAVEIAPCYYVAGNHESRIEEYDEFEQNLQDIGVVVLNDEQISLTKNGETIELMGILDPTFETDDLSVVGENIVKQKLDKMIFDGNEFTVLLAHRPELFEIYSSYDIDLVVSGHTHGGQVRLPFIGSLAVPSQGFFPKYDAGEYSNGNTKMIISRGIGNSMVPLRINNPPEVVLIELKKP